MLNPEQSNESWNCLSRPSRSRAHKRAAEALQVIIEEFHEGIPRFSSMGVTDSGKTEVYLRAIAHCLQHGRQAIMMVPEISLTEQTIARFTQRFSNQVAVLHSGLSKESAMISGKKSKR